MTNLKTVKSIFQREFKAYFDSPVAYVFLVAFLLAPRHGLLAARRRAAQELEASR